MRQYSFVCEGFLGDRINSSNFPSKQKIRTASAWGLKKVRKSRIYDPVADILIPAPIPGSIATSAAWLTIPNSKRARIYRDVAAGRMSWGQLKNILFKKVKV